MGVPRIAVVTDSTAYLPPEMQERFDISVIPLHLVWEGETMRDGVDIGPTAFYERLQAAQVLPTTSQPSAGEFVDFFQRVAEQKNVDAILGVFISSDLSGTVASAEAAKGLIDNLHIEVVDSRSTSWGLGFQVMAAAEAVQAGGSLESALAAAREVQYRVQVLFVVDTLEFLHRGGRIGGAQRLLGTVLRIKPLLELEDGKIEALDQVRTKKKALARLLDVALERKGAAPVARAGVIHANAPEECGLLQEKVKGLFGLDEVYVSAVSPVIGTHVGPGTLGLAFYTQ